MTATGTLFLQLIWPTAILLVGVTEDLRTRKVRNKVLLPLAVLSVVFLFVFSGWESLMMGLLSGVVALLAFSPLFLGRVVGGGDVKLMMVFGLVTQWTVVLWVLLYSLIWGAIFGLILALLRGQLGQLLSSTVDVAVKGKRDTEQMQRMPFTVVLFFGWLSIITATRLGGLL